MLIVALPLVLGVGEGGEMEIPGLDGLEFVVVDGFVVPEDEAADRDTPDEEEEESVEVVDESEETDGDARWFVTLGT